MDTAATDQKQDPIGYITKHLPTTLRDKMKSAKEETIQDLKTELGRGDYSPNEFIVAMTLTDIQIQNTPQHLNALKMALRIGNF